MQNLNKDVLQQIWERQESLKLGTQINPDNQRHWSKLLYFTLGNIAEYLASAGDSAAVNTDGATRNKLQFSGKYLELITGLSKSSSSFSKDTELQLFAAAAYYFGGYPGAAAFVAETIDADALTVAERTLYEVLMVGQAYSFTPNEFLSRSLERVLLGKDTGDELLSQISNARSKRLFSDSGIDYLAIESAIMITRLKISNSVLKKMPTFSNTNDFLWKHWLNEKKVFPLLWESQIKIGESGVYSGQSAVIQMPTGAGKTAAMSLIIRSALASNKLHLAIVVAPFKSIRDEIFHHLSNEFKNEEVSLNKISEELVVNLTEFTFIEKPSILVVTPEKLLFMLSHNQQAFSDLSMVIFDEAHQIDNGMRGITFELLLATINILVGQDTQQLFISAVVGNPHTISEWFNSGNSTEVSGLPKRKYARSYGLAFWNSESNSGTISINPNIRGQHGWTHFNNVVGQVHLTSRKSVPNYSSSNTAEANRWFSVLLSKKFLQEGMVAVFYSKKSSLLKASESFTKYADVSTDMKNLLQGSKNSDSLDRLANLLIENFGANSRTASAFQARVFIHDGDIPEGIRNAVEYEAKENNISLLLCTTTLAQGVNLPIQTMIISSVGNGLVELRDRDLQNLVGRVGRPGISNEGNVIFMNGESVSTRAHNFSIIDGIIRNLPVENLGSSLLNIFQDEKEDPYAFNSQVITAADWFTRDFVQDPNDWIEQHTVKTDFKRRQIFREKAGILFKIESFLMSLFDIIRDGDEVENLNHIIEGTFAAYISNGSEEKNKLRSLFLMIFDKIVNYNVPDEKIKQYGMTLKGINDASKISEWVEENESVILQNDDIDDWIIDLWPLLRDALNDKQIINETFYQQMLIGWINGDSYAKLLALWLDKYSEVKIGQGRASVEKVFQICNSCFQFEMSTVVPAIAEFTNNVDQQNKTEALQRAIRLGLRDIRAQQIYVLGINDRCLAMAISELIPTNVLKDSDIRTWLRNNLLTALNGINRIIPDYYFKVIRTF